MKSKEEIIEICHGIIDEETISPVYEDAVFDGLVMGYTRCQENMKKEIFTKEEIEQVLNQFTSNVHFDYVRTNFIERLEQLK